MDNKSCIKGKHQYGLWNIDKKKNIVYRNCDKCNFKLNLPITEEVVMEIVKQNEASKIYKAFQLVSDNDENLINYLELIIDDYINYLSKDDYAGLVKRIKLLEKKNIIDTKNILYLHKLRTYFEIDNNSEFINNMAENIEDSDLAYEQ